MLVSEAVGATLAELGVRQAFGVVGSGNFDVTNALLAGGARYVPARHEGGAATMADAYARMSGEVSALTLHQGCGLTNAMTGITEAAKSRTPMLVLAAESNVPTSNFAVDQAALAAAVGASTVRLSSAADAVTETVRAFHLARDERRTVVVNLPLEVQGATALDVPVPQPSAPPSPVGPSTADVTALADLLRQAQRPVLIAGRGAREARNELLALADACGALVATSAVARGLFNSSPWSLDVSGGFASPLAASLITDADVIVGFGCALNMWTMRHGRLIGTDAQVAQVDIEPNALGKHRPIHLGVVGDSAVTAAAVTQSLPAGSATRYREEAVGERIAREIRWRDVPYEDWGGDGTIDPRTLTIALDDLLPAERVVAVDSGNFMGYPSMFLSVPDEYGFCFTQAFQSIGLGLATAIGAALAQPSRLPVAALGDGGALMAAAELDTVRRLGLPMLVVVYDDAAYGAEVHHFADGQPLDTVTFPDTDIAAIGAGYGLEAAIVRTPDDLDTVRRWVDGPRDRALLVDAKVAAPRGSWWLEEAFRGH
ncbi:MAG TPA: thiamine pyrophosphate-binding protein [Jiangellaceae bacterium]|nr:thiamine pyrophosphate-binding protein [Jiangellaceae bacterium]